jgi:hypothetical protein
VADYEERIVAFVDILGFRDLVEQSAGPYRSVTPDEIQQALGVPEPAARDQIVLGRIGDISKSGHRMTAFSDSIVITADPTEQGLTHVLFHVEKIGFRLIRLHRLCRGGITRGLVYHDDRIIFGPAWIEAYDLERKTEMPRVVLSENVVRIGLSAEPPIAEIFTQCTRQDDDCRYFVNILRILRMIMNTESGPPDDVRHTCSEIEQHLHREFARLSEDAHKRRKIEWFKRYFDWAQDRSMWEYVKRPFPG